MANIRHAFVSGKADGADPTVVRPSDWNAELQYTDVAGVPSGTAAVVKQQLGANTTFYVRTNGLDSTARSGLSNTDAVAFATPEYALDQITKGYDFNNYTVTISVQSKTFTSGLNFFKDFPSGLVNIDFNGGTIADTTEGFALLFSSYFAPFQVSNVTLSSTTGDGINIFNNADITLGTGVVFGTCAGRHMFVQDHATMNIFNSYSITGGADAHFFVWHSAQCTGGSVTVTLTGTPAFGTAFAVADMGRARLTAFTFSGSATGIRYQVTENGVINTGGGGANYFPGNQAGVTATGGIYG